MLFGNYRDSALFGQFECRGKAGDAAAYDEKISVHAHIAVMTFFSKVHHMCTICNRFVKKKAGIDYTGLIVEGIRPPQ